MSLKKLFTKPGLAVAYSKFRPTYPEELYNTIMEYLKEKLSPPYVQAVDVGCGSGQNTCNLASFIDQVVGYDISEAQIEEANKTNTIANVKYRVGSFDKLLVADQNTDLVTSALAAHWFHPIDDFYKEVDRVLKPGGVLAVFGYGMPQVQCQGYNSEDLTDAVWQLFNDDRMQKYVMDGNREVRDHYKNFSLPYSGWKRIESMSIRKRMTVNDFLGYLTSWSFYWKFVENHPDEPDPILDMQKRYQDILGDKGVLESQLDISWPIFLLIGRKPVAGV